MNSLDINVIRNPDLGLVDINYRNPVTGNPVTVTVWDDGDVSFVPFHSGEDIMPHKVMTLVIDLLVEYGMA